MDRKTACIQLQDPTTWTGQLPVSSCKILLFGQDTCLYPAEGPPTGIGPFLYPAARFSNWERTLPVSNCKFLMLRKNTVHACIQLRGLVLGQNTCLYSAAQSCYWEKTPACQDTCVYSTAGSSYWDRTPVYRAAWFSMWDSTPAFIRLPVLPTGTGPLPVSSCRILLLGQDDCLYPAAASSFLDRTSVSIFRVLILGQYPCLCPGAGKITRIGHVTCLGVHWERGHLPVSSCKVIILEMNTCLYPAARSCYLDRTPAFIQLQGPAT